MDESAQDGSCGATADVVIGLYMKCFLTSLFLVATNQCLRLAHDIPFGYTVRDVTLDLAHVAQLLVTEFDFRTPERRSNLSHCMETMLKLGVLPILNENDAVSGNEGYEAEGMFSDNDGLASLVAVEVGSGTSS